MDKRLSENESDWRDVNFWKYEVDIEVIEESKEIVCKSKEEKYEIKEYCLELENVSETILEHSEKELK